MSEVFRFGGKTLDEACIEIARKAKLIDDDGRIQCWDCGQREGLLPSLHCGKCLGAAYVRMGITSPWCINKAQTKP